MFHAFHRVLRGNAFDLHRIVFQLIRQFIRAPNVKLVGGRAVKFLAPALDVQRIARGIVGGKKLFGRLPRDHQLAELGDDDRPTEQRQDEQHDDGDFALGGGVLDGVTRGVGGKQGMNKHGG